MQTSLTQKHCKPCEGGIAPLTPDEYGTYLRTQLHDWVAVDEKAIQKEYRFKNFAQAIVFINDVARLAESEGHHPDILLYNWNKVRLTLSTHAIGGLSENDFILASKIDEGGN